MLDLGSIFTPSEKEHLFSISVLTTSFWTFQNVFQRGAGLLGCHGGRPFLVTSALGAVTTTCSLLLSQFLNHNKEGILKPFQSAVHKRDISPFTSLSIAPPLRINRAEKKRYIRETYVGLLSFMLLEKGGFRTAFPSSVIALGVFANHSNKMVRSMVTNSPVATSTQRLHMQKLGKRFGCHQCGKRQLFNRNIFIADHMPPTKMAIEKDMKWYRRLFSLKLQQRLWPQCYSCFQTQGSAVKTGTHVPIYHFRPNLFHLAPALAYVLLNNKDVLEAVDTFLVNPTMMFLDEISIF